MKKLINYIAILLLLVPLSGCLTSRDITTKPLDRLSLDIVRPKPLQLRQVQWKVIKHDQVVYFSLDAKNFENLTKNIEDAQNRLFLQNSIITKQIEFYEK